VPRTRRAVARPTIELVRVVPTADFIQRQRSVGRGIGNFVTLLNATDQLATRQLNAFMGVLPKSHRISELDFGLPK
jgi:hypothetical protein